MVDLPGNIPSFAANAQTEERFEKARQQADDLMFSLQSVGDMQIGGFSGGTLDISSGDINSTDFSIEPSSQEPQEDVSALSVPNDNTESAESLSHYFNALYNDHFSQYVDALVQLNSEGQPVHIDDLTVVYHEAERALAQNDPQAYEEFQQKEAALQQLNIDERYDVHTVFLDSARDAYKVALEREGIDIAHLDEQIEERQQQFAQQEVNHIEADNVASAISVAYEQRFGEQQRDMASQINADNPPDFDRYQEQYVQNMELLLNENGALKAEFEQLDDQQKHYVTSVTSENAQQHYIAELQRLEIDTSDFKNQIDEYNKKEQELLSQLDSNQISEIFGDEFGTIITLLMGLVESFSDQETAPEKEEIDQEINERKQRRTEQSGFSSLIDEEGNPLTPVGEMTEEQREQFEQERLEFVRDIQEQDVAQQQDIPKVQNAIDGINGITNLDQKGNPFADTTLNEAHISSSPFHHLKGMEDLNVASGISLSGDFSITETVVSDTTAIDIDAIEKNARTGRS